MILLPPEGAERVALTRDQALAELRAIAAHADERCDPEEDHRDADGVLLRLIGDDEITAAFGAIPKWYA